MTIVVKTERHDCYVYLSLDSGDWILIEESMFKVRSYSGDWILIDESLFKVTSYSGDWILIDKSLFKVTSSPTVAVVFELLRFDMDMTAWRNRHGRLSCISWFHVSVDIQYYRT